METRKFYGYPRGGFVPETKQMPDGTLVAHADKTPFWCTQDGRVFVLQGNNWSQRKVSGLIGHPAYGRRQPGGCHSGERYPHLGHAGKNYAAHKLMALAWMGPIPTGWEVDHLNGNILDWRLENLQWVTVGENVKRARLLRVLRSIGRDPRKMGREELLTIFSKYEFEDPAKRMEYEMTHHMEC